MNFARENAAAQVPGGIPGNLVSSSITQQIVTSDGIAHPVRFWAAQAGAPIAVYLHGIEGHSQWFEDTAVALNKQDIAVYAPDRRGAGLSSQPAGDIGSYTRLVDDIGEIVQEIIRRHPGSPIFLIGNCWGGKVALTLAGSDQGKQIKGLILTSPAVATQVDVTFGTKLKIALSYLLGGRSYFDIPLTPEHFTDNPPYLEYVASDPLRLKRATARFFVQSLILTAACKRASLRLKVPVLVLQSGRDAIVHLKRLEGWFSTIGSADKTLKIFTSAAHSLDFEANPTEYQMLLASWINTRASQPLHRAGT
ncbi:MAG TPA: alpha/beta fold hydrolase [Candidatus Obscuribacterales bacterium]